jgi:hypothetical protein
MFTRVRVVFALVACVAAACATEENGEQTLPLPGDVEVAANHILRHTLAYHSAATSTYSRVKGELEEDRYALVDELQREIEEGRHTVGGDLESVAEELLEHMQGAREDVKLVAEVYYLIQRYIDLVSDPHAAEPEAFDDYLWDSIEQRAEMSAIVNPLAPESSERAYYITPAFNFIAITRLVLYASRRGDAGDVRAEIDDAIKTNREAVGTGEADELGLLSTYVTSRYAGAASAREKNDADPVVYSLRRMLAEQEAALE